MYSKHRRVSVDRRWGEDGSTALLPRPSLPVTGVTLTFFFSGFKAAALGATARRTARAAGRICPTTDTCSTGPCTRATITGPVPCTWCRPSWAADARTCARPPISCATPSCAYARPTSSWAPTANPAHVSRVQRGRAFGCNGNGDRWSGGRSEKWVQRTRGGGETGGRDEASGRRSLGKIRDDADVPRVFSSLTRIFFAFFTYRS